MVHGPEVIAIPPEPSDHLVHRGVERCDLRRVQLQEQTSDPSLAEKTLTAAQCEHLRALDVHLEQSHFTHSGSIQQVVERFGRYLERRAALWRREGRDSPVVTKFVV